MSEKVRKKIAEICGKDRYSSAIVETEKINFEALVNYAKRNKKKAFFWAKPSERYVFFALDKIFDFSGDKNAMLSELDEIKKNFTVEYPALIERKIPYITGSIKFNNGEANVWSDFSFNDWFIPRFVFLKYEEKFFLIINVLPGESEINVLSEYGSISETAFGAGSGFAGGSPLPKLEFVSEIDLNNWNGKIKSALKLIENGSVSKIVISRFVKNNLVNDVNYYGLISRLSENFPFCTVFGYHSKNSFFFGATPETLFNVNRSSLETDALAGSISRGKTIYEDEKLANELLASDKNLREHRNVVEFILSKLEAHAKTIAYNDTPKIRKLRNIQHLWTPIKAELYDDANILSLLYDLHPTPAVCGSPKETAYEKIHEIENFERGLFTGVVGWFNFDNIADFSVAIRSALIKNNELYAYAGCGIVKGSDAKEEFAETKLKLKPILSLFDENEY